MKIIDRQTFLAMPSGTLYSKYQPCCFGDLMVKESDSNDIWMPDFVCSSLVGEIDCDNSDDMFQKLEQYQKTQESFSFDLEASFRDGLFEYDQLFAVYEQKDIDQLIERLRRLKG